MTGKAKITFWPADFATGPVSETGNPPETQAPSPARGDQPDGRGQDRHIPGTDFGHRQTKTRPTKTAEIIALMQRLEGAGLDELAKVTNWLPHTIRAALTGLRRKGLKLERTRNETGQSVYRIAALHSIPGTEG